MQQETEGSARREGTHNRRTRRHSTQLLLPTTRAARRRMGPESGSRLCKPAPVSALESHGERARPQQRGRARGGSAETHTAVSLLPERERRGAPVRAWRLPAFCPQKELVPEARSQTHVWLTTNHVQRWAITESLYTLRSGQKRGTDGQCPVTRRPVSTGQGRWCLATCHGLTPKLHTSH